MADEPDRTEEASSAYLAPSDLREHDLPSQAALGFHRGRTEELLDRAADTIERLRRELLLAQEAREVDRLERSELKAQLEDATKRAELLVGEAMVDAHRAGQTIRAEAEADAQAIRAEAEALLEPARREAQRLVAEAREQAKQLVAETETERERLAAEAEQYKLLAADVQQRSIEFLKRGLEALGEARAAPEVGEDELPFAAPDEQPRPSRSQTENGSEPQIAASQPLPAEAPEPSAEIEHQPQTRPAGGDGADTLELASTPAEESLSYTDDPMARLWQNAGDRDTGAEAIEAIRARRQLERDGKSKKVH